MNPADYPANWKEISAWVRFVRAKGQCECCGECYHGQTFGHHFRCQERAYKPGLHMRGKVILTVAHLCACRPLCGDPGHLRAMCQSCHLRFDRYVHHKIRDGRIPLFPPNPPVS